MKDVFYVVGLAIACVAVVSFLVWVTTSVFTAYGFAASCVAYVVSTLALNALGALAGVK
jgi:hypothetical protein